MFRTIRSFAGFACLASAFLSAGSGAGRTAFAADEKKEEKKLELPKLPKGSNPKWDFESVEEKFTIIKGGINDNGWVYFLLELKENIASSPSYKVVFTDSDGVKIYTADTSWNPDKGKKGDRVRMAIVGVAPASTKDTWVKAVKVKFVAD